MTPLPDTLPPGPMRARAALAACAAVLLVGACGGGSDDTLAPASDDAAIAEVSDSVDDRRFTLWAPGQDAAVRAEQAAIDADAPGSAVGDSVRLIVRLNPAAA